MEAVIVYTNRIDRKEKIEEAIVAWAKGYDEAIEVEFGGIDAEAESGEFAIDVTEPIFGLYDEIHAVVAKAIDPPEGEEAIDEQDSTDIEDEALTIEYDESLCDDSDDFRDSSLSMTAEF